MIFEEPILVILWHCCENLLFGTFIFKSVDLSWFLKPFSEEFQHILTVKKCEEHFINLKNLFLEWKVSMDLHGTKYTNNLFFWLKKI